MAATTIEIKTPRLPEIVPGRFSFPVRAGVKLLAGTFALIREGVAEPGGAVLDAQGGGRVCETVDNTGGATGAMRVEVDSGTFGWQNSAGADEITQAHVGDPAFVVDNQTFARTDGTGTRSSGGKIVHVEGRKIFISTVFAVGA